MYMHTRTPRQMMIIVGASLSDPSMDMSYEKYAKYE